MTTLVLADLRARWRSLAGFAAGCFILLMVLAGTYSAYGGADGFGKAFGGGKSPKLMTAFSGSSSGDIFSPANFLAFGFAHPLFLVLTIAGPMLVLPLSVTAEETVVENGRPLARTVVKTRRLYLAPAQAKIATDIAPETRRRSIYAAIVYGASVRGTAQFHMPADLARLGVDAAQISKYLSV